MPVTMGMRSRPPRSSIRGDFSPVIGLQAGRVDPAPFQSYIVGCREIRRENDLIESLLLAVTRVTTVLNEKEKTNATGFFFERDERLYLVTARHVLKDEASDHHPDSLLIELHVDPDNAVLVTRIMIPLFRNGQPVWREGADWAGEVDVAVVELDRAA